ncbi:hypothetical protein AA313_de0210007 [Arthrobotrys entomopaga]|nr:hypothetical protein AA313_de0210007 [Arthrobotrys entomopaga]
MQFRFFSVLLFLFFGIASAYAITSGQEPTESYMITFPKTAPEAFVQKSIEQLKNAGARVTHSFGMS